MKRYKIKIDDPDNFIGRLIDLDEDGNAIITIKEGELPPAFPKFHYEEVDE